MRVPLAGVLALALLVLVAPPAWAGIGDYDCPNPSKVYLGNPNLFQRPCTVDCDRIYSHIPEYQEILRRNLTDRNPEYHILMKKATKRFTAAVKKMAAARKHDLVAQKGAVTKAKKDAKDVPDRTDEVIRDLD
jgi:hypothetical protein